MRKLFAAAILMALLWPVSSNAHNVKGYYRDTNGDGIRDTYVQPYQQTSPNNTRMDNYSYPGNYNPNTGGVTPQPQQQPYSAPAFKRR